MNELRKREGGRVFLGLLILSIGAFLTLVNLQLASLQVVGLWPLFLIIPGSVALSLAVMITPPESRPLRPLHGDPDQFRGGPLVW